MFRSCKTNSFLLEYLASLHAFPWLSFCRRRWFDVQHKSSQKRPMQKPKDPTSTNQRERTLRTLPVPRDLSPESRCILTTARSFFVSLAMRLLPLLFNMSSKLIFASGATGAQGSSVVSTISSAPGWRVRRIIRNSRVPPLTSSLLEVSNSDVNQPASQSWTGNRGC